MAERRNDSSRLGYAVQLARLRHPGTTLANLVIDYHKANASPVLRLFLQRSDALAARVAKKMHIAANAAA